MTFTTELQAIAKVVKPHKLLRFKITNVLLFASISSAAQYAYKNSTVNTHLGTISQWDTRKYRKQISLQEESCKIIKFTDIFDTQHNIYLKLLEMWQQKCSCNTSKLKNIFPISASTCRRTGEIDFLRLRL